MGDTQDSKQQPTAKGGYVYAGFFRRLAALLLDFLIVVIVLTSFSIVLNGGSDGSFSLYGLISVVFWWGYPMYFIGVKGQTPGKMALSVKVITKDGGQVPGYMKAFLREIVGKFVSSLIFGLGFFWMIWDKDKQTWHDKIAGTVVIKIK